MKEILIEQLKKAEVSYSEDTNYIQSDDSGIDIENKEGEYVCSFIFDKDGNLVEVWGGGKEKSSWDKEDDSEEVEKMAEIGRGFVLLARVFKES